MKLSWELTAKLATRINRRSPRLLFRSAHIYMLLISLVNLSLGLYLRPVQPGAGRYVQVLGSAALIGALGFVCLSFFTESLQGVVERPYARQAIYLASMGMILHVVAAKVLSTRSHGA